MHRLYPLNPYCFIRLKCKRQSHVIIRDDIHPWPDRTVVGVRHVDGRHAEAEVGAVDLETHGTASIQAHGLIVVYTFRVIAGYHTQGYRITNTPFDERRDGGVGQLKFQVGIDGQCVDIGLLHVVEQVAMLAVGGIEFRADTNAGEVADLILCHASYAEMIGDFMHDDGTEIIITEFTIHMETELSDRIIETRRVMITRLHHRPSGMVAEAGMRWPDLCLSRHRQYKEEAQG